MNIKIRLGDGLERAYHNLRRALAVNLVAWGQSYGVYMADFQSMKRQSVPPGRQTVPHRLKVIQVMIIRRLFADETDVQRVKYWAKPTLSSSNIPPDSTPDNPT